MDIGYSLQLVSEPVGLHSFQNIVRAVTVPGGEPFADRMPLYSKDPPADHFLKAAMKSMSSAAKLMILLPTGLVAIVGLYGYWEWQSLPDKALMAGKPQYLEHTVGAILQTRSKPTKYLLFTPEEQATALAGAELRFRGQTQLVDVQLSADKGDVAWRNGRFDNHSVPGLLVHVQATIRGGNTAGLTTDTLILRLPGLSELGKRFDDDPRISYNGNTPRWGDSLIMQRYTYYPDELAIEKARRPYLALAIAMGLVVLAIVARVVIWMIGSE